MIFKITIMGRATIIPKNPHSHPHTERETRIIKGEIPRFRPWILGSIKLPKIIFVAKISKATRITGIGRGQNCINANNVVTTPEIIEPKLGIKLRTKAINPQMIGKSKDINIVPTYTHIPVSNEIKNFIEIYRVTWDTISLIMALILPGRLPSNAAIAFTLKRPISVIKKMTKRATTVRFFIKPSKVLDREKANFWMEERIPSCPQILLIKLNSSS